MAKPRTIDKAAAFALPLQQAPGTPASSDRKLALMFVPCPPIPPGELGRWMETMHDQNLHGFLDALETARAVWRKCPQLVEAPTLDWIPPEMVESFLQANTGFGYEDGQLCSGFQGDGLLLGTDYPAHLQEQAQEMLAYSIKKSAA